MIVIKTDEGKYLTLTEGEFKKLNDDGLLKISGRKTDVGYLSSKITSHLQKFGDTTFGVMFNKFRSNRCLFDKAIDSLLKNGDIKIEESHNKYNKSAFKTISLVNKP